MTKRAEFSPKTKAQAWERSGGFCENVACGARIMAAEYDHIVEDYISKDNSLENCRVLCGKCHKAKTKRRRPEIDKTRRGVKNRSGLGPKSRGFQKPPPGYDSFRRQWKDKE